MLSYVFTKKGSNPKLGKKNLGLQKYQWLTPHVHPLHPEIKSLRNEENDDNPETTDTSRTDKDDMSQTNRDYYIENMKDMKKNNNNDE